MSGTFTAGQREIWNLLIDAHRVGITTMKPAAIAFEPIFSVGRDAYYLEDMIHITAVGAEILSAGLPYTAQEIEAAMRSR